MSLRSQLLSALLALAMLPGCASLMGEPASTLADDLLAGVPTDQESLYAGISSGSFTPDLDHPDYVRGLHEETSRRWSSARDRFADAAQQHPDSDDAVLAQARTFHAEGRPHEAGRLLTGELRHRPSSPGLLKGLAAAALATGQASASLQYYKAAHEALPVDMITRVDYAVALFQAKQFADVVGLLNGVRLDALPAPARLMLGRAGLLAHQVHVALPALESYLRLHPADAAAWLDLARGQMLSNRPAEGLAAAVQAQRANASSAESRVLAGHALVRLRRFDEAASAYTHAIQLGASAYRLGPIVDRLRLRGFGGHAPP